MSANSERGFDWSRLLRSDSHEFAQDEIGRWFGSSGRRLALGPEQFLDAWRQARREISRVESGLAARSRELDLLQSLGRRAAEARCPEQLFEATAALLHEGRPLDVVLAGPAVEGAAQLIAFLARPVAPVQLAALASRAAAFLGWSAEAVQVERRELDQYDEARGVADEHREEDLILLPILRRGRPAACLLVASGAVDEERLRVLYSASNQLSLHLDRILTVREAEADRFRSIVDSMPQGVVLADAHLRVLQANRAARAMVESAGLTAGGDLTPLVERLGLGEAVDLVRSGRVPLAEGEFPVDGERFWSATISPVLDGHGRAEGLLLVVTDVSERRRLQSQLMQSEKMSGLGSLISGVAHELNNPLASILGYAQLMGANVADEKLAERLGILRREAERCKRIVLNLLSFARQREPEIRPLSLNQVVESTVALLSYQLRVDDIRVVTELDLELPLVRGDAHQLEQVLVNLLTNARHAIREANRPGRIVVRTAAVGGEAIVLEVRDNGVGISEEVRSRIFDPFFTTKPTGKGTGLGLSIVYGIVAAHGGTIEAHPAPAGGTSFRLTLAVATAGPPDVVPALPEDTAARRGRILVVDDEEPLARLICETLAEDGHATERVGDAPEALSLLARQDFDLIISDLKMPGMDGEELGRELERRKPGLSKRLLLTSGDTLDSRPGREVLHKPFDLDELRRIVRRRLGPSEV